MKYVYLALLVIASVSLATDFLLRFTERIRSFGLERRLFRFSGKTIPIERFFPQNLTMVFVMFIFFGAVGLLLELISLGLAVSLPCAVFAAFLGCFTVQTIMELGTNKKPKEAELVNLSGLDAVCTERIEKDGYGKVKVVIGGKATEKNAVSIYNTSVALGEKVVAVSLEQDVLFVEKQDEIYNIFAEDGRII